MVAMPQKPDSVSMTELEYLEEEEKSEIRHQFINGEVYAMAGASRAHGLISVNLTRILGNQLRGKKCALYPADVRVKMPKANYTYPDLSVVCDEAQFVPNIFDTLMNPTLILEILSPSTEAFDRGEKFRHYRHIPSLREYILVAQDTPRIERYMLLPSGIWGFVDVEGVDASIELSAIGCTLLLAEVYEDVPMAKDDTNGET